MPTADRGGSLDAARERIAALEELVVGLTREIRERDERAEREAAAERLDALENLAGGVAHDIGNLMAAIAGYSQLALADLPDDHPAAQDVREVASAAERVFSLLRQLLSFSRQTVVQPRPVDLAGVVGEIDPMLRRLLGEAVELRLDLEPGCAVVADRGPIEQAVVNLVVNARDAMPRGGVVTIRVGRAEGTEGRLSPAGLEGPSVRLAVADTGTGVDPDVLRHIFEPFFTTKGSGRGLGLATVYGTVKQLGGVIDVQSAPGGGATFTLYLPAAPEEDRPLDAAAGREPKSSLGAHPARPALVVGWVERDEAGKALAREAGRRSGCDVQILASNAALLAADEARPFAVAVVRVHDRLDPNEAAARLRERSPRLGVALSRNCDHAGHRADPAGFDHVFPLPFDASAAARWLGTLRAHLSAPAPGGGAGPRAEGSVSGVSGP